MPVHPSTHTGYSAGFIICNFDEFDISFLSCFRFIDALNFIIRTDAPVNLVLADYPKAFPVKMTPFKDVCLCIQTR